MFGPCLYESSESSLQYKFSIYYVTSYIVCESCAAESERYIMFWRLHRVVRAESNR